MPAKLIAEEGLLKDLILSFEEGDQWVIGRDPDSAQLLIEDPAASRRHVLSRRTAQGIIIENLSSTNPVMVNEEVIHEPRLLQNGEVVKIGDTFFRYYAESDVQLFEENTETNIPEGNQVPFPTQAIKEDEVETDEKTHDTIFEEGGAKPEIAQVNFDMMETGRWLLKVVSGPNNGAEFSMHSGNSYVIGTDPNTADIVFYDNSVSRQHARITISKDDKITIEDQKSRNGTRVDGELITSPQLLPFNTLVSIGTTSFVVYDREGEMQTIISPLLPSIVKVLQKEEKPPAPVAAAAGSGLAGAPTSSTDTDRPSEASQTPSKGRSLSGLIVTAVLIGLFGIVSLAVQSLFVQAPIAIEEPIDINKTLSDTLNPFPGVKSSYNKATGRLLLVGHVLAPSDKHQLLYNLQGLKFIKEIDDTGVVIDEYVWNEANLIVSKNPEWRGVSIQAPSPGRFVVTGYLQSRAQAQQVWDYLSRNFPYLDLLENKLIVEENIISTVNNILHNQGLTNIKAEIRGGDLVLNGVASQEKRKDLESLIAQFREIPGVRTVRNLVASQAQAESVVNISDRYVVSGLSKIDGGRLSAVINGRILSEGDVLDGMRIKSIQQNVINLEKDGMLYRIDFNR